MRRSGNAVFSIYSLVLAKEAKIPHLMMKRSFSPSA
jgi:hypothetical protein